jgi:hypothetical protein
MRVANARIALDGAFALADTTRFASAATAWTGCACCVRPPRIWASVGCETITCEE